MWGWALYSPKAMNAAGFYPNVTTLRSGRPICYRKSVCRLSVCNVRAPYLNVETFGYISLPLCTLATL